MAKLIMRVEGLNGQVELLADRVVIHRKGLWNALTYGLNAKREIPLSAMSEVQFKEASRFNFGEIEFVGGGRAAQTKKKINLNAVKFRRDKNQEFEMLKEKMFEIMEQYARNK